MSIERVREYFKGIGIADRIIELDESSATVELASKALNVEAGRIAKTLSFRIGDQVALIVLAGDVRIDNRKFKDTFNAKAKMLAYEETEALTGHRAGGVCPFAVNEGVEIYLDESLKRFDTVYPACGSPNSAIELTPDELMRYSGCKRWVDVGKI